MMFDYILRWLLEEFPVIHSTKPVPSQHTNKTNKHECAHAHTHTHTHKHTHTQRATHTHTHTCVTGVSAVSSTHHAKIKITERPWHSEAYPITVCSVHSI